MAAQENPNSSKEPRSKTDFKAAFWVIVILAGLFIAALNFISAMSTSEEEPSEHHGKEATTNETLRGESGLGKTEADSAHQLSNTNAAPGADSSKHEAHY